MKEHLTYNLNIIHKTLLLIANTKTLYHLSTVYFKEPVAKIVLQHVPHHCHLDSKRAVVVSDVE
jgi:hypothetical protein